MIKIFRWEESPDKKRHLYVWAGAYNYPLGFVTFQWRGWKGKIYIPGAEARYFQNRIEACTYVEAQLVHFMHMVSAP